MIILLVFPLLGLVFFAHQAEHFWRHRRWGHVDGIRVDPDLACCKGFCSVPGPLQSVQRAEMWGVSLALQTSRAVHLGVDNLGVVRHVGRLLDGCRGPKPFELVNDGDLLLLIDCMLRQRGLDTVCISKVKGHADDGMVMTLLMRLLILDVGGSVLLSLMLVVTSRGGCGRWYPVILDLHRFFIAISRTVVNHDGRSGTAPDPLVWSAGALHKET